jgi:hypothetical protein
MVTEFTTIRPVFQEKLKEVLYTEMKEFLMVNQIHMQK